MSEFDPTGQSLPPRPDTASSAWSDAESVAPTETGPDDLPTVELLEPEPPRRPPGPGLPESLLWTAGIWAIQLVGLVVALMVLIGQGLLSGQNALEQLKSAEPRVLVVIIAVGQALFLAAALIAVPLRLWAGRRTARLPLRPVAPGHALAVLALIVPVAMLPAGVRSLVEVPQAEAGAELDGPPDEIEVMKLVEDLAGQVPLSVLLLLVAVVPAVAEELVFRGAIGRGLVARWGMPAGILLTSILFAVAHMQPLHALQVLHLGIVIHLVYLATRSFWAPVLYHFLNNSMAVVALAAAGGAGDENAALPEPHLPLHVTLAALVCVVLLVAWIWRTRVQFRLPDGGLWTPGYPTAERPPHETGAVAERRRTGGWLTVAALLGVLLFWGSLAAIGIQSAAGQG